MIFRIYEERRCIIVSREEFGYKWGLRKIKSVREGLERRNVEERVIKDLDSIKDFWKAQDFYSSSEGCEPCLILEKALTYFVDERRTKYADCEIRVKELFDKLREYLIEDKNIKQIKEIIERKEEMDRRYDEPMTAEDFFGNIDYAIKEMKLLDKYTGSNHEKEISIHYFVKDTMIKFGISDSYAAQALYKRIDATLDRRYEASKNMPSIILELEMYRCVIKQSMGTKNEMLGKFNYVYQEK